MLLIAGSLGASLFMALSGFFTAAAPLLAQRLLAGVASALVFIAGGLLAARLGARQPQRSGFLLGIYYGGTGLGIVISALGVPPVLAAAAQQPHGWAWAWWALALVCLLATALMAWPARVLAQPAAAGGQHGGRALPGCSGCATSRLRSRATPASVWATSAT